MTPDSWKNAAFFFGIAVPPPDLCGDMDPTVDSHLCQAFCRYSNICPHGDCMQASRKEGTCVTSVYN